MRLTLAWIAQVALAAAVGCGCGTPPAPTSAETPPAPTSGTKTLELGTVVIQPVNPDAIPVANADVDALPPGAILRLGSEHGKPPNGWNATLLPTGTRVLALHSLQQPYSFRHFTLYDVDGLKSVGPATLAETNPGGQIGSYLSISADGKRMGAVNINTLEVHDLTNGKRLFQVLRPEGGSGQLVSLSADGKRVAIGGAAPRTASNGGPVACTVWDVDFGKEISRVTVLQNSAAVVLLSPDGKTLITSGTHRDFSKLNDENYPEKITQIWDVDTKAELARVKWPQNINARFSPDSKTIAVRSYSPVQALLVDARTGKTLHTLDLKETGTGPIAFTPNSKDLWVVAAKQATRWNVATGQDIGATPRPPDLPAGVSAYSAEFDAAGRLVVFGSRDLSAFCWDAIAGKLLSPAGGGHSGPVRTVAFTPDGAEVRTASADGAVLRWSADSGKLLGRFDVRKPDQSSPSDLRIAANGGHAVLGTTYTPLDGKSQPSDFQAALNPDGYANGAFPTADGSLVAVVGPLNFDKPARCLVFDIATGNAAGEVPLPAGLIRAVAAISKDRKRLVTAYSTKLVNNKTDVVVTGWELPGGRKLGEYTLTDGGAVRGVALLDGKQAVVATGMGHVKIVDVETGTLIRDIADPTRLACTALTVSRDGKLVAVGQTGRQPVAKYSLAVRVYDVTTGAVRHTAPAVGSADLFGDSLAYANAAFPPEAMAFSPDGSRLVVPALTTALMWDLNKLGPDGPAK